MNFTPADSLSLAAFVAILLGVLGAITLGVQRARGRRAAGRFLVAYVLWLGGIAFAVRSGFLEAAPFPRTVIFMAASNLLAVILSLSPLGGEMARRLSAGALVGFQAFRLPLEIVLHAWAVQGVIPESMTWSGSNWDIVTGVVSLACAPGARRSRALAWFANVLGFALLLNVMRVAVLSSPFPFAWPATQGLTPPLQLAFHLPYAWIVPIAVSGALAGHLILTRKLLNAR